MELMYSLSEINIAAQWLLDHIGDKKCLVFHGEMGAGKTTLISTLCTLLGAEGNTSSPTFSIINEYSTSSVKVIYHIDLYRLKDEQEAIAAGVEDCILSGDYCFVEWPERASGLFLTNTVNCFLSVINADSRKLSIIL